jgi:hypothetical protein
MKDKLIIIATIQYILEQSKLIMMEPSFAAEKMGVLKGINIVLLEFYYAITGNHWSKSPKELHEWMIQYIKKEADSLGQKTRIQ